MSIDSPASILFDSSGNPVGIILDGSVYRLQVQAKLVSGSTVGIDSGSTGGLALDSNLTSLNNKFNSLGQKPMTGSVPVTIASDQTTLPISAGSLPLPTGAATETTLAALLTENTFTNRINTLGQKLSTNSTPVVLASDQSTLPVSAASLPLPTGAATESTLSTLLLNSTFTGRINTLGQKTSANSTPVVLASDQSTLPVSAASLPLPAGAATESTLSTLLLNSTFTGRINTLGQKTSANSTPVVLASDQSAVSITNVSIGSIGAAILSSATQMGGSDGTNLQTPKLFDLDSGGGTDYVLGVSFRLPSSGGSVVGGTSVNPIFINTTGLGSASTGQLSITTTSQQIANPALSNRKTIRIKAISTNTQSVYLGFSSGVSSANGDELSPGEAVDFEFDATINIWMISASGTQRVSWTEVA